MKPSERDPEELFVGDVVSTALHNRAQGVPAHLLELLSYEGDEVYYLDLSRRAGAEAPVVMQDAAQSDLQEVAPSFDAFLRREL